MSYLAMKKHVVSMVENCTGLLYPAEFGERFRHLRESNELRKPHERGFFGERNGSAVPVESAGCQFEWRNDLTLTFYYPAYHDADLLDVVMASDYEALSCCFADQSNWGQPQSTICLFERSGDEIFIEEEPEEAYNDLGEVIGYFRRLLLSVRHRKA